MKRKTNIIITSLLLLYAVLYAIPLIAYSEWSGVDETVVERFAKEHGREAKDPIIPLEGDLALFAFLVAGAVGGIVIGYHSRALLDKEPLNKHECRPKATPW